MGWHIGFQTMSDISVIENDPTKQGRMVSYFDVITDKLFSDFIEYGINLREDVMISKEVRDANPITCSGDTFVSFDTI